MSSIDYTTAWFIYLVSALGCCWVWWLLTNAMKNRRVQTILRLIPIAILVTPYFSDPQQDALAPALLVVVFEGLFGNPEFAFQASIPILVIVFGAIIAALMFTMGAKKPSASD